MSTLRKALRPKPGASAAVPVEHWGLSADANGVLSLEGVRLPELAERFGSPLHVVSARRLRDNARRFLSSHGDSDLRCELFYSYKTNPVPGVLSELHRLGVGAEVISHYELWLALELGVPPELIVYNGPGKSEASVRQAISAGIQILNLNHREEIALVARVARELGRKPRVGLRATVGTGWQAQFGTPAAGDQALRAFEEARDTGWLDVVGLHVHRGGMLHDEAELEGYLGPTLELCDQLRSRLGLELEILNLGGSLAAPSVRGLSARELRLNRTFFREMPAPDPQISLPIERYVALVCDRVSAHFRQNGARRPRVFLEPGRAMTSDTQLLLTRVSSIKRGTERRYAILDAGINLAESCRGEYHQLLSANHARAPYDEPYSVVGPICSPADTLYWSVHLPELSPGDSLAIMDAGAYFVPFSTSFSFPRPAIVMVDAGDVRLLRRAEEFTDLMALDQPEVQRPR